MAAVSPEILKDVPGKEDIIRADVPSDQGLYDTCVFFGEKARYAAVEGLQMLDTPPEEPFDRITKLMTMIFQTPVSLITLVADPTRVWFKSCVGPFGSCVERDGSWCNYILVPSTPEILITEDASKDARFAHNPFVAGEPFIKFYAGAPLVGARGERYGTLCIVDLQQRAFTAELYSMLNNFAALAVEELERNKVLLDTVTEAVVQDIVRNRHLDMSLTASREGALMMDMRDESWPILYVNPAFETTAGIKADKLLGNGFWDNFERVNKTKFDFGAMIGKGDSFEMTVMRKKSKRTLTIRFMAATSDRLAPSKATGIPSWVPSEDDRLARLGLDVDADKIVPVGDRNVEDVPDSKCFWFAIVVQSTNFNSYDRQASTSSTLSSGFSDMSGGSLKSQSSYGDYYMPIELMAVTLGPLLGSGSFGKVFRGQLDGSGVAVKIIDGRGRNEGATQQQLEEIRLTADLDHPFVVKMLHHYQSVEERMTGPVQVAWIVQELCDLGTLTQAAERGWLRTARSIKAPADMSTLLPALRDIADAMAYVHSRNIIHADLTGRNVLLTSSTTRSCGFLTKVCDFGISRQGDGDKPLNVQVMGTCTHMPPEVFIDDVLYPACDVWSFGVIAWEAFYGKTAYTGKSAPQIVLAVAMKQLVLEWPEDAHLASFVSLMKHCLDFDHLQRPSFKEVLPRFEGLSQN